MSQITTATGQAHEVLWCGISHMNGDLFFDMLDNRNPSEIIEEFDDAVNTERLLYHDGRTEKVYEGYTQLKMFGRNKLDGSVRLALARPAAN